MHNSILKTRIIPRLLIPATRVLQPKLIIKTGQCGAGKSYANFIIQKELGPNIIPVDFSTDMLRDEHPYRYVIYKEHYKDYDPLVKKDAYKWQAELIDEAISKRANIIFEKVLTEPNDWNLELFRKAKSAGYSVECVAMGVHRLQSLAGMYLRRERRIAEKQDMLPIPLEKHDKCYQNLPSILENMEKNKSVDIITIYNRDASFQYKKDLNTQEIVTNYPDASISVVSALKISRESFKKDKNKVQSIYQDLEQAEQMMMARNSETKKLEVIKSLRAELQAQTKFDISKRNGRE